MGSVPIPRTTASMPTDIRFSGGTPFRAAREHAEVLTLIRSLVDSAGIAVADRPLGAVTLDPLNGGRSAARVFKLTPFFGHGRLAKGPPVVVKIASRAQGRIEKANYDKYVRRALPAACRPDLLGFGQTRVFSGLCYSFAGGSDSSGRSRPKSSPMPDTLTDCLRRGEVAVLKRVLHGFFDPLRDTWYGAVQLRAESDIARHYLDRYFTGPRAMADAERTLLACAARYYKAGRVGGRIVIGELSFPSPRATLFAPDASSGRKRAYRSCILHGDLNSDNIIIADLANLAGLADLANNACGVTVVDFQKTGRGHVHEDLIHVEESVRINYMRDASFGDVLEKERLIALGRRRFRNDPYCASIRKIRDTACGYFGGVEDETNYHFAIAAIGLRLMQAVDLTHIARARITASTLWAAKVLAGET